MPYCCLSHLSLTLKLGLGVGGEGAGAVPQPAAAEGSIASPAGATAGRALPLRWPRESGHRRGRAGLGGMSREAERVRAGRSRKTVTSAAGVMATCELERKKVPAQQLSAGIPAELGGRGRCLV